MHVDQDSSLISAELKSNASTEGINVVESPIENPESMSNTERYHGTVRTTFERIKKDLLKEPIYDVLRHAVYCVKNTVGLEGLCPALCVFGTLPKPIRASPSPDHLTRARVIDYAITLLEKEYAKKKYSLALNTETHMETKGQICAVSNLVQPYESTVKIRKSGRDHTNLYRLMVILYVFSFHKAVGFFDRIL